MNYLSIHGNDRDGWSLMLYNFVKDRQGNETDAVTTAWEKPMEFATFDSIAKYLNEE